MYVNFLFRKNSKMGIRFKFFFYYIYNLFSLSVYLWERVISNILWKYQSFVMFHRARGIYSFPLPDVFQEDTSEVTFTEDDYRRRKPHLNYTEQLNVEKLVIKLGKMVRDLYLIDFFDHWSISSTNHKKSQMFYNSQCSFIQYIYVRLF